MVTHRTGCINSQVEEYLGKKIKLNRVRIMNN